MDDLFFEIFDAKLPRLGPGMNAMTIETFNKLPVINKDLKVLEVGCGNGAQTLVLAGLVNGTITATDFNPQFLEELNLRSKQKGFEEKITTVQGDMNDLKLPEEGYDIVWCEGAIFIMGFEKGLEVLKKFLKPGGFLVLSDLVSFSVSIPAELKEFFDKVDPNIKYYGEIIELIKQNKYKLLDNYKLPDAGWDEYYIPITPFVEKFEKKYAGNEHALTFSHMMRYEMDIFGKYKEHYGYMFFVMQKP